MLILMNPLIGDGVVSDLPIRKILQLNKGLVFNNPSLNGNAYLDILHNPPSVNFGRLWRRK